MKPTVAVVFGGRSGEHAISCVTAAGVLAAIDPDQFNVLAIGITQQGRWVPVDPDPARWQLHGRELPHVPDSPDIIVLAGADGGVVRLRDGEAVSLGGVDVVFPLLHGPFGEDGTLQGLLEMADMRYVGSGVLASAVGMDKHFMKVAFQAAGIGVGPWVTFREWEYQADAERINAQVEALGMPVFVKPARAGSSLGISKVHHLAELPAAIAAAAEHDPKIVVEATIVGREIECAVLGSADGPPRTSLPGEIVVTNTGEHEFYDFEAKYLDEASVQLSCPADLSDEVTARVREQAAAAFMAIDGEGLARADFFVGDDGTVTINEINTLPGFTPFSMYPRMWEATGLSYPELVNELLQLALARGTGLR